MVFAFGVSLELVAVKIDFAQVSGGIALGFVVEVAIAWMAAFASCGDCPCSHTIAELDYGNETVSARAVPLLCIRVGARAEGSEGTPDGRGEAYGDTRFCVIEMRRDVIIQALKAIDVAPGSFPG